MAHIEPKNPPKKVLINFNADTLEKIEDFRYANRFPSRMEAVNWLLDYALKQKPKREKSL